jgi:anaerobic dimethyl sulfoxide reductase subunit A
VAVVEDGRIVRLEADDRPSDDLSSPRLVACARGRAYLERQYHPDRLTQPLRRVGRRGEGRFERISWDDALDLAAGEIRRVRETYGNGALFVPYGTGAYSNTNGSHLARRLFNLYGGCLGIESSYSWACTNAATPTVYGTLVTGNERQDWINAKTILMWGWNPAEMIDGTNTAWFVKQARERGAHVVCIDPRKTMSAVGLADEWVPIRPGTDVAMMSAMAHVMIEGGLYDRAFVHSHCVGFDSETMPVGAEGEESYEDYILGRRDGQPKTPAWAEAICGVAADTIRRIAMAYATRGPAVLYQGYGVQRRAYGEQVVRAGCVLAAITGNVGIPGGSGGGLDLPAPDGGSRWIGMPLGENPYATTIPVAAWSEAVLHGRDMGRDDGVRGRDHLESDIKLIYAVATNCLVNQHMNVNRSAEILRDESRVECLIVQDQFLTPTARFADLVLPACTAFETWGLQDGWKFGDELLLMPKLVAPLGESRSDYAICAALAPRLGIGDAFTEGRDERQWVDHILTLYRDRFPDVPDVDAFEASNIGVHAKQVLEPRIALADFRRDPEAHPLDTPSGRIEIFSTTLHALGKPDEIPAIPKYVQEWESPFGEEAETYPLQAIGSHTLSRVHSTHANNPWLQEAFPQRVFLNPHDAMARGIQDGDAVAVFNDRGRMVIPCRVTNRIMPGVVDIPQGAWWAPDADGVDRGGATNVLTSERLTPFAHGTASHTMQVQVEREAGR